MSVHLYVQLARMKRASYRLAYRGGDSVTDIALDAGYEAPEAFARAFRQRVGQSPSDFRKAPDWEPWQAAFGPYSQARTYLMTETFDAGDVRIVETMDVPVARITHRGDPALIGDTIRRFIAWRKAAGLRPPGSATYNIFWSVPDDAEYRLDICAGTGRRIATNDVGVEAATIPGGRCAVLRVIGSSDDRSLPANWLYREWLPDSGEEPRDFPLYCQRISFFPDVPEHEAVTDLYLPLR